MPRRLSSEQCAVPGALLRDWELSAHMASNTVVTPQERELWATQGVFADNHATDATDAIAYAVCGIGERQPVPVREVSRDEALGITATQGVVSKAHALPDLKYGVELEGYIDAHPDVLRDSMRDAGLSVTRHSDTTAVFYDKIKITRDGSLHHSEWFRDDLSCDECEFYDSYGEDCNRVTCIKNDTTYGIELVFPPVKGQSGLDMIERTFEVLSDFRWRVDDSAGLHVHVDSSELKTMLHFRNLVGVMALIEPMLIKRLPLSRRNNRYCQQMSYRLASIGLLPWDVVYGCGEDLSLLRGAVYGQPYPEMDYKYSDQRYYGLNLHSHFYRGTVEFRYFQGAKDYDYAASVVELCTKVVEYCTHNNRAFEDLLYMADIGDDFERVLKTLKLSDKAIEAFATSYDTEIQGEYYRNHLDKYRSVI